MKPAIALSISALVLAAGASAQAGGPTYRAVGTEPFWRLTIDARTMRYDEAGRPPIVVARPPVETGRNGERYSARGLIVDTVHAHCTDGMSDRVYRDIVILDLGGGRTVRGCGEGATGAQIASSRPVPATIPPLPQRPRPTPVAQRPAAPPPPVARPTPVARPVAPPARPVAPPAPPAPPPLPPVTTPLTLGKTHPVVANTHWTVWKVQDVEVKAGQPMTVNFSGDRIEGKLCNRFAGAYRLTGERLQAGNLMSTRMACQGPVMGAEAKLFALLRQPMRVTVSQWGTMILTNGRDTVMLRPAH